jgi:molecular chaperone GrpE
MTHQDRHAHQEEVTAAEEAAVTPDGVHDPAGEAGSDPEAAAVEADLDELREKAAQRDEYLALAQRTQADFENYRKRMARENAAAVARRRGTRAQ